MNTNENETLIATPKASALQSYAIPLAIVCGFGLIALAIYFSGNNPVTDPAVDTNGNDTKVVDTGATEKAPVNPVTDADFLQGDPNAPIKLVEYSDFDCPFCRIFHDTMTQVMAEYGESGKVAWVHRQLPLQQLHPNAPTIAEASECVGELGGDEAFWAFADALNESREITYDASGNVTGVDPTDMNRLPEFAAAGGVDETAFTECLQSGRTRANVEEDFNNAAAIGARGTPYTVVMVGDKQGVINGAQPYSNVKQVIEGLLKQIEG
ncbi:thioredoxin domain-containing protein [Candidatus Kaiserbacteria bacterium]|nr:thioredoxin domain-containing protein [Candidatus Kaiserbacteria bacterium]MCP5303579.1 thioredoxin domain-containing protein [Pseudomonadales bacterium]